MFLKNILKQGLGISIVEVLVSTSILGLSAYYSLNQIKHIQNISKKTSSKAEINYYHDILSIEMKKMLLENETTGMCSLVIVSNAVPGGISENEFLFTGKDFNWGSFFKDWNLRTCASAERWARCFGPKNTIKEKDLSNVIGKAKVIPIELKKPNGKGLNYEEKQPIGKLNINRTAFELRTIINYTFKGKNYSSTKNYLLGPGAMGECIVNGDKVALIGTGPGDALGDGDDKIYTSSAVPSGAKMTITFPRTHPNGGIKCDDSKANCPSGSDKDAIMTDPDKKVSLICREKRYRCRNRPSSERTYYPMDFKADISYNDPGRPGMFTARSMKLCKDSGSPCVDLSSSNTYFLTSSTYDTGSPWSFPARLMVTNAGFGTQYVKIKNKSSSPPSANTACRAICNNNNNFNRSNSPFRGSLCHDLDGNGDCLPTLSSPDAESVTCQACYKKSCKTSSTDAFGFMDKQPAEPLDSRLPECYLKTNSVNMDYNSFSLSSADKCVLSNKNGTYQANACDTDYKAICYQDGKFRLSNNLGEFNESSNNCFRLGEISYLDIINVLKRGMVERGGALYVDGVNTISNNQAPNTIDYNNFFDFFCRKLNEPTASWIQGSDSRYPTTISSCNVGNFMNVANQGIFISPDTLINDIEYQATDLLTSNSSDKFWTNLKYDSLGYMYSPPPVWKGTASDSFGYYFKSTPDENKERVLRYTTGPESTPGANTGLLLYHDIRTHGVVASNSTDSFKVLCDTGINYKAIYGQASSQASAIDICENAGHLFLPPITSTGWTKSMMEVAINGDFLPFPGNPTDPDSLGQNPVRIGYKYDATGSTIEVIDSTKFKNLKAISGSYTIASPTTGNSANRPARCKFDLSTETSASTSTEPLKRKMNCTKVTFNPKIQTLCQKQNDGSFMKRDAPDNLYSCSGIRSSDSSGNFNSSDNPDIICNSNIDATIADTSCMNQTGEVLKSINEINSSAVGKIRYIKKLKSNASTIFLFK